MDQAICVSQVSLSQERKERNKKQANKQANKKTPHQSYNISFPFIQHFSTGIRAAIFYQIQIRSVFFTTDNYTTTAMQYQSLCLWVQTGTLHQT